MTTPTPIAVTTICSVCGLGWELHGGDPTTDDCIRLLKAELARRPYINYPIVINNQPVPQPWRPPHYPWYYSTVQSNTANSASLSLQTPRTIEATCSPITS